MWDRGKDALPPSSMTLKLAWQDHLSLLSNKVARIHHGEWDRGTVQAWMILAPTLQRHNTENSKQIFPEKELRCLSPNFQITVCERFIYSQDQSAYCAAGKYKDRFWEYINRSQTHECGNRDWGRAISFLGIPLQWMFTCHENLAWLELWPSPCPKNLMTSKKHGFLFFHCFSTNSHDGYNGELLYFG